MLQIYIYPILIQMPRMIRFSDNQLKYLIMNPDIQCGICLEKFNTQLCPRVCNQCGNSICEKCLIGIFSREGCYLCPFCKFRSEEIWTKNISIINMIDHHNLSNLCALHKRVVVSLCCSTACGLPVGICDLAQCSKMHKERGTNSIPLCFLEENVQEINKDVLVESIEIFYQSIQCSIRKLLTKRKQEIINEINEKLTDNRDISKEQIIRKIKNCCINEISSQQLYDIKVKILGQDQNQQEKKQSERNKVIQQQIHYLSSAIDSIFKQVNINWSLCQKLIRQQSYRSTKSNDSSSNEVAVKNTRQIIIYEQRDNSQIIDNVSKFIIQPRTSPEYNLIQQAIEQHFVPQLIFNSHTHKKQDFKSIISNKSNLLVRIQLQDGKIFGCFLKGKYPSYFQNQEFILDPQAFVYWLNTYRVYKASQQSVAQYDICSDYLLSVGSTYKLDGFWFKNDFDYINSDSPRKQIKSLQFTNLCIPLPENKVERVDVFVLHAQ